MVVKDKLPDRHLHQLGQQNSHESVSNTNDRILTSRWDKILHPENTGTFSKYRRPFKKVHGEHPGSVTMLQAMC